jgi:hypothetical protein
MLTEYSSAQLINILILAIILTGWAEYLVLLKSRISLPPIGMEVVST